MDPISQGALGAAAALSIWGDSKKLPPRVVGWLGALSGMAADLDVFIRSSEDSLLAIQFHRHFTHSLAFVPVGAVVALLPWLLRKDVRKHLRLAYLVSLVGYLTHAPLDCTTTYGTLFFWPFSDHRVSLSFVSVVDPVYTLPLLACTLIAAMKTGRRWAQVGLSYSLFYLALGALQNHRAMQVQAQIAELRDHHRVRADVFTTFMNQVSWRSLYEAEGRIHVDEIRVPYLGPICVKPGSAVRPLEPAPPSAAPGERRGRRLLRWFSSGWVARDPSRPELMGDLRYSVEPSGTRPFWGVIIDENEDQAQWVSTNAERSITFGSVVDLIFRTPPGSLCGDAIQELGRESSPSPKSTQ